MDIATSVGDFLSTWNNRCCNPHTRIRTPRHRHQYTRCKLQVGTGWNLVIKSSSLPKGHFTLFRFPKRPHCSLKQDRRCPDQIGARTHTHKFRRWWWNGKLVGRLFFFFLFPTGTNGCRDAQVNPRGDWLKNWGQNRVSIKQVCSVV